MAGLGRKEWSPGDTLTASDVNGYLMDQSVMVFAGTAARASAIPSPSAGMVAYSTATSLQVYNGSAWTAVTPTSSSGLVYLTGASFSAVASVSLPTSTFTATYSNYRIIFDITSASVDSVALRWRLRASGTDSTAASYNYAVGGSKADSTVFAGAFGTGQTSGIFNYVASTDANSCVFDVIAPQASENTKILSSASGRESGGAFAAMQGMGYFGATTAFDSMTLYPNSGTITGSYKVYAYANS